MIKNIIFDIGGVIFDDSDLNLSKLLNKDLEEVKKLQRQRMVVILKNVYWDK